MPDAAACPAGTRFLDEDDGDVLEETLGGILGRIRRGFEVKIRQPPHVERWALGRVLEVSGEARRI
jgi:hypothetical protein